MNIFRRRLFAGLLLLTGLALGGSVIGQNLDVASFGKAVTFMGLVGANRVELTSTGVCPTPTAECVTINPVTSGVLFEYDVTADLGNITLSRHVVRQISLIYQMTNIIYEYEFENTTAGTIPSAFFHFEPYVTLESNSPLLNDPACIDPNTGMACNGKAVIFLSAGQTSNRSLASGERDREHQSFTRAGSTGIGKQSLMTIGWPQATVDEIFDRAIIIRLHVKGSTRRVNDGFIKYELRLFGDD